MAQVYATAVIKAKCISRQELRNGVRYSTFIYENHFTSVKSRKLKLVIEDHDLILEWTISRSYFMNFSDEIASLVRWDSIKLPKCDRGINGKFEIFVRGDKLISTDFNATSLPFEVEEPGGIIKCPKNEKIKIAVEIYREDDRENAVIEDYDRLFRDKRYCDVTFVVGDEEIPAHRLITQARSEVFAAMFEYDMTEKKTGRVDITDIEPGIFKQLLRFIYCGKVDSKLKHSELLELAQAANKYSIKSLLNICLYRLSFKVSRENVMDILIVADRINAGDLKKECIEMVIELRLDQDILEGYQKLRKDHPDLVNQICDAMMQEEYKVEKKICESIVEIM